MRRESDQQIVEGPGVEFGAEEIEECLRFGFAHAVVRVIERQHNRRPQRRQQHSRFSQQLIVAGQSAQYDSGRHVQLGQPPPVVIHLLQEIGDPPPRRQQSGRGSRRDFGDGFELPGIEDPAMLPAEQRLDLLDLRRQGCRRLPQRRRIPQSGLKAVVQ